ncbi:hypothetical protein B0F90DRAFT_1774445 [Multifurca ochricompacta]|uniref:Nephrocystin 3-like N-terminal domain-containing protein n=1 Tax=Multifurca ochricompacta TaxID=376703 RepID=A0AAD4LW37_9AGAM|nr:hypothetical protein B0F90DRAFT_1774445 [Multifurca ochricompacta]
MEKHRFSIVDSWKAGLRENCPLTSSTVIEEIIRMREAGMALARLAYFYFDRKNTEKQDARALVSSLLVQLSEQSELYSDILSRLCSTHAAGSRQPGYNALLECLKDMLFVPGEGPIYVILDGLNESPRGPGTPSVRESVLKVVKWLVNLGHSHLHICISSRMEADIQVALSPLASQTVCLHEEIGHIDDINYYIDFFINSDVNTRPWMEEDKKMVINKISEEADGMFLWASCRLDQLGRCLPGGIERTLDEFPETMEVVYERVLLDIDEKKWEAAHLLFQFIAVAPRPLHVSELAEFFAFDFKPGQLPVFKAGWRPKDLECAILSTCSSLISIIDANGSRVVQFSHFSVKQYLTSYNLAKAGGRVSRHHFSVEDAQTTVAQGCLATLFQFDEHVNKSSVAKFPLAIYAAQYLVIHASSPNVQLRIRNELDCLFDPNRPHFAIWVWIYDVDENSGQSMISETPPKPQATPLYYASQFGLIHVALNLANKFPFVIGNTAGYYGTAINAASVKGHSDIVARLCEVSDRILYGY